MRDEYTFNLRVITPLFMDGANHEPEIRTQSLNGVFRWWFRVAGGSREDEERIFGSASDARGRRGLVNLALKPQNGDERTSILKPDRYTIRTRAFEKRFNRKGYVITGSGWNYLGFSLDQRFKRDQDRPKRSYIVEDERFALEVSFHPLAREDDKKKFFAAMWLAFNLGNFGARARRGFGSIGVEGVEKNPSPFGLRFMPNAGEDFEEWLRESLEKIRKIFGGKCRGSGESRPCIWDESNLVIYRIVRTRNYRNWVRNIQRGRRGRYLISTWQPNTSHQMLDFMGFLLAAYRSYYQPDHDEVMNALQTNHVGAITVEKSIFGLPLQYFYSSLPRGRQSASVVGRRGEEDLRFASPLIIKISRLPNSDAHLGMFVLIRRPVPKKLALKRKGKLLSEVNMASDQWEPITHFLETLQGHDIARRIYP